jgi:hypothetical protein
MIRSALAAAVALAVGLVVGRLSVDDVASHRPEPEHGPTRVVQVPAQFLECPALSPSDLEALERTLMAVVATRDEELRYRDGGRAIRPTRDTTLSQVAGQQLHETVDAAIAVGRWTADDAAAVRDLMQVAPEAGYEALAAVAVAVNAQMLEVEPGASLF